MINYTMYVKDAKERRMQAAKKRDAYEAHMTATALDRAETAAHNNAYCKKHGITGWSVLLNPLAEWWAKVKRRHEELK